MIALTHDVIDYASLTDRVCRPGCGGVVLFLGTVRDLTGDVRTIALEYESYGPMAEKKLAEVEAEVRAKWPVGDVAIVHRLGRLTVGEVSVAIAVSCPHRADAFEACRYAIDRVKELVPIWKQEQAPSGEREWIHRGGVTKVG
jgi:molybdopterin synthase catalytic subunit